MKQNLGLVLSGGGARATYQAGVLRGIADIFPDDPFPFNILTGVSGGAINATFLACYGESFQVATQALWDTWEHLKIEKVFRVEKQLMALMGLQWIIGQNLRGILKQNMPGYLMNAKPMYKTLQSVLNLNQMYNRIHQGIIRGVAFSATNLDTGIGVTFFDGQPSIRNWFRRGRLGIRTSLTLDHVVASSAIPLFFPPIPIQGSYYGDGCIRMSTPLSPAIHLGSDRILAIGIHHPPSPQTSIDLFKSRSTKSHSLTPSMADVLGILLDAVFLDSLEMDLERMQRINKTVRIISKSKDTHFSSPLKSIPVIAVRPSRDLGEIASKIKIPFPYPFRHILRALGSSPERTSDLLSYLAFNEHYTRALLQLGYQDALAKKNEIRTFFRSNNS